MRALATTFVLVLSTGIALADQATPMLPADAFDAARHARKAFEQGHFSDAEKIYEQILTSHPDNVYTLSNLGVVKIRLRKIQLAETRLKRAIAIAPNDAFSHYTLGIIYCDEHALDSAFAEMKRAIEINPNYGVAQEFMSSPGPVGDFDTLHERLLRQPPGWPAVAGEIGLSSSDF